MRVRIGTKKDLADAFFSEGLKHFCIEEIKGFHREEVVDEFWLSFPGFMSAVNVPHETTGDLLEVCGSEISGLINITENLKVYCIIGPKDHLLELGKKLNRESEDED